jgi:hypothetical protein
MPRPTFDAANSSTYAVSVTVGTATMAFASMVEVGSAPPDDLTWGGNTMTSIVTGSNVNRHARLARYAPPGSGAQAVSTNDPNAISCVQRCGMTLLDVDTATPVATSGTSNGTTASVSIAVGTVTADQIVVWAIHTPTNGTETISAGTATTVRAQSNTPDNNPVAIGTATGDINLTWSGARDWLIVWAVVNGTPSGPTATPALGRYRVIGGGR